MRSILALFVAALCMMGCASGSSTDRPKAEQPQASQGHRLEVSASVTNNGRTLRFVLRNTGPPHPPSYGS